MILFQNKFSVLVIFSLIIIFSLVAQACTNKKARNDFKTVKGIYSPTEGGKGGKIIRVTNLNISGKGSFLEAVNMQGPRIIVFEVGGVINLAEHKIIINKPDATIAGQTAPSPGITLIRGGISIATHDVIIRDITVRPGDAGEPKKSGWESDGISMNGAKNVLIDHCTTTWATDEGISASGPRYKGVDSTSHNVIISNCLVAEGLSHSTHSYGEHSKGSLIHDNSRNITVMRNLFADNKDRNPYYKSGATGIILNNLIYNPGDHAIRVHIVKHEWKGRKEPPLSKITIIGNVLIPGQNTTAQAFIYGDHAKLYVWNNKIRRTKKDISMTGGSFKRLKNPPVWHNGIKILKTDNVYDYVLANAGARPADRSTIDQRIIKNVKEETGQIIDSQEEVGGYPNPKPVHRKLKIPEDNVQDWLAKMVDAIE